MESRTAAEPSQTHILKDQCKIEVNNSQRIIKVIGITKSSTMRTFRMYRCKFLLFHDFLSKETAAQNEFAKKTILAVQYIVDT